VCAVYKGTRIEVDLNKEDWGETMKRFKIEAFKIILKDPDCEDPKNSVDGIVREISFEYYGGNDLRPLSHDDFSNPTKDQKQNVQKLESKDGKIKLIKDDDDSSLGDKKKEAFVQKYKGNEAILINGLPHFLEIIDNQVTIFDENRARFLAL